MKQILHDFRSGKVILADVPTPVVAANSVLVHNQFSALSPGTERAVLRSRSRNVVRTALERKDLVRRVLGKARRDGIMATLRAVGRKLDSSLPLGYSSAGVVVEVGADVTDLKPGDAVACAGAGYASHAEYVCVPRLLCALLPQGTPLDAAAFATLGAIAMHGVRQAEFTLGETVAVLGLGIVGQLTAQIVEAAGGHCLGLDVDASRVALFAKCCHGAGVTVGPEAAARVMELTDGRGVDRVIITAASRSNEPIILAASLCRDRARVVVVGDVAMDLPRAPFYEKEIELRLSRSYGPGRYDPTYEAAGIDYPLPYVRWTENRNMEEFLRLVHDGRVRPLELVTHRFAVGDVPAAYEGINSGELKVLGALIEYPRTAEAAPARKVPLNAMKKGKDKIGVALVGAGNFARGVLLPALAKTPHAQLVAVCSGRGVNARDLAAKYGAAFCTSELEDVLADARVDAVVIATRHNLHADQARRALAAGKSVYLEKPLCLNEAELAAVTAAARASKSCLCVGYNRRFAPLTARLSEAFHDRRSPLTLHYRVNAGTLPADSWVLDSEVSGGRLVGEACHFIDLAKFIIDRPLRQTTAHRAGPTADDVTAALEFGDGSLATVSYITSGPEAFSKERIEVIGGGKVCIIDDFRQWTLHDGNKAQQESVAQDKGHHQALAAFVATVRGEREPAFTLDDLAETSRITFVLRGDVAAGIVDRST